MKKIIIFLAIIIVLFIGIAFITNMQNSEKVKDNPYGKNTLRPETVDQLDDPNYRNIITPEQLKDKLDQKEDVTVYFYSPTCGYCKEATPVVNSVAKELGINVFQYNVLEFEQGWNDYAFESIPTIVHFKNGKEEARISGYHENGTFKAWFNDYVVK